MATTTEEDSTTSEGAISAGTGIRTARVDTPTRLTATAGSRRFQPGDEVVVRYITRMDGRVGMSWPYRVVQDDDELVALYIPAGATYMQWHTPPGDERRLVEARWRRDVLRLMFPGRAYSVWLFWEGSPRRFTTYYVNLEEPFRRTPIGFDTNDHTLDILVAPDLTWSWKDRDDFEGLIASGNFSPEFGEAVERAAREALDLIEGGKSPFCDGWDGWTCPESWATPALHPRWREEPPALWEQREWAYPLAKPIR